MADPYQVLDISPDADDKAIRKRYLELVRQFPPEQHPEKFAAIRAAYEELKNLDGRLYQRLFQPGKSESWDAILEDLKCQTPRRRIPLAELLRLLGRR